MCACVCVCVCVSILSPSQKLTSGEGLVVRNRLGLHCSKPVVQQWLQSGCNVVHSIEQVVEGHTGGRLGGSWRTRNKKEIANNNVATLIKLITNIGQQKYHKLTGVHVCHANTQQAIHDVPQGTPQGRNYCTVNQWPNSSFSI